MKKRIVVIVHILLFACSAIAMKKRPFEPSAPSESEQKEMAAQPSPAQKTKREAEQRVTEVEQRPIVSVEPTIPMAAEPSGVPEKQQAEQQLITREQGLSLEVEAEIKRMRQIAERGEFTDEIGAEILKKLAEVKVMGATEDQKLFNAIHNIRNFMVAHPQYYGDVSTNRYLIEKLAARYAQGNVIKVAIALATTGAGQWLREFLNNNTDMQSRMAYYAKEAARNNQLGALRFIHEYFPISALYAGDEEIDVFITALEHGSIEVLNWLSSDPEFDINYWANEYEIDLLMVAVRSHQLSSVDWLLKRNVDPNIKDKKGNTPLMIAAGNGLTAIVDRLLKAKGIDVNASNIEGWTALQTAALHGHLAIVNQLLNMPLINVNAQNRLEQTALIVAARQGYLEIVDRLLQVRGIDIYARDFEGLTALASAVIRGYLPVVNRFLQAPKLSLNQQDLLEMLTNAARTGHLKIVERLLQVPGINVNAQSPLGWSALMLAAYNGHLEITERLLKVPGIDVNIQNQQGWTALKAARKSISPNKDAVIKLLIDRGATE